MGCEGLTVKLRNIVVFVGVTLTLLQGCGSSSNDEAAEGVRPAASRPQSSTQVDVINSFITSERRAPTAAAANSTNLFTNPGFESGLNGWTDCQTNASSLSTDAFAGNNALALAENKCFYQSVEVTSVGEYALSCFAKLVTNQAWTGMGMAFVNSDYRVLGTAPVAVVTADTYTQIDTKGTAPAGTSFISMWIHSDHGALVDNCSLQLESDRAPAAPVDANNLLANGDFSVVNAGNSSPAKWTVGCAASVIADGASLYLSDGTCVDQSLSVGAIQNLKSAPGVLSCLVTEIEGYSDLSVFLDNELKHVQVIEPNQKNTRVALAVDAARASNGFVTLYSEGHLQVEDCVFSTSNGSNDNTPTDENNGSVENSARYRITFNATWSARTHPVNFPPPAHFSGLAGAVHNDQVVFWRPGALATSGITLMAETGDASELLAEVATAVAAGTAAAEIAGNGVPSSPGSTTLEFEVTRDHPLVTITSMVAPSPDWFIGVRDLALFDGREFVESLAIDLAVYDAGTDSGRVFITDDVDTQPRAPITRLSTAAIESNFVNGLPSMGQFVITKLP